jgi:phage tail sheath protein FI
MAYQLSPGVNWTEIDLTTIVPAASTTEGAFAGEFDWGPVNEIHTISNEVELVRWFGKPSSNNSSSAQIQGWWTAANFLAYGDNLQIVRALPTGAKNASANGNGALLVKNREDYELNYFNIASSNLPAANAGMFIAKYPSTLSNGLTVSVWANNDASAFASWAYASAFDATTSTSSFTSTRNGANDELHIVVLDTPAGTFSGTPNAVLERFSHVSKAVDAKNDDGSSNYYVNVLNEKSEFIYATQHARVSGTGAVDTTSWGLSANGRAFTQGNASYTMSLTGGVAGVPTDSAIQNAYSQFTAADSVDVSLIMTGAASNTVAQWVIQNVAEVRKDCVVFVSPAYSDVVGNPGSELTAIKARRNFLGSSSYAVMDSAWKYQFDKYYNVYRWVPMNGDVAGLCARTDQTRDPWFSPAGLNRGQIKNVYKLSWAAAKADRDELYKNGVNPIVTFKGDGTVLYGDKTLQSKPSAFDRINVRRLFIVLEKTIARASKYSLFEFNDEFTRSQFVALVEPFLRDVKGRRGIYDFRVVCDETNNTPEVIDRNEFIGDIYVKPARSINFIQLNFVAVRTGVAFSEIVGKF